MGTGANSDARAGNSLRDTKERAAGRQNQQSEEVEAIKEFEGEPPEVQADGAFGRDGMANRESGKANPNGEGGGGGGGSAGSDLADVKPGQ
ncbi:MAG TPA: hypothetical protein VF796_14930 [Humisphaera sp.]